MRKRRDRVQGRQLHMGRQTEQAVNACRQKELSLGHLVNQLVERTHRWLVLENIVFLAISIQNSGEW